MWLQEFIKDEDYPNDHRYEDEVQKLLAEYDNGEKNRINCHYLMIYYAGRGEEENALRFGKEMMEQMNEDTLNFHYHMWEYYHHMARLYVYYQRWETAIEFYMEALEQRGESLTFYELAACYAYIDDMENAEYCCLQALEVARLEEWEPDESWIEIASLFCKNEKYQEAIEIFSEYAKHHPTEWPPLFYIGQCWHSLKDEYRAMAFYHKALAIEPNNPHVYNCLGTLAINEEASIQEGIAYLKQALEYGNDENRMKPRILMNLVRAYMQLMDYEQAAYYKDLLVEILGVEVEPDGDEEDE